MIFLKNKVLQSYIPITEVKFIIKNLTNIVHWEDPEGSGREGGGSGDQDGEYM